MLVSACFAYSYGARSVISKVIGMSLLATVSMIFAMVVIIVDSILKHKNIYDEITKSFVVIVFFPYLIFIMAIVFFIVIN